MTDEAQRRVKAADLPPPRRVGADDFARIVRRFQIPDERRPELREFLDGLTNEFAAIIARERSQPDRRADRGHIDKAQKAIAKAQYEIKLAGGPAAAAALRRAAGCIGEMISASWTRKLFRTLAKS